MTGGGRGTHEGHSIENLAGENAEHAHAVAALELIETNLFDADCCLLFRQPVVGVCRQLAQGLVRSEEVRGLAENVRVSIG